MTDQILYVKELLIILCSSIVVITVSAKFKVPSMVGLIFTGLWVGPFGMGWIKDTPHIESISEWGVVFLLFVIGLEFSIKHIKDQGRLFFVGGALQALLTLSAMMGVCVFILDMSPGISIFFSMMVVLSSTALVFTLLYNSRQMESPQGRISTGILIFQDLLVVPFMLIVPILGGDQSGSWMDIGVRFLGGILLIAVIFTCAHFLFRYLFKYAVSARVKELSVLSALLFCLGGSYCTEIFGFSLALGAFLSGILIADSDYAHQIKADIEPFKDVFMSLFFIGLGMLIDINVFLNHFDKVVFIVLGLWMIKVFSVIITVKALLLPLRTAIMVGLFLSQIGEFSFVLLKLGQHYNLIHEMEYQLFLSASILTMILTPLWFMKHKFSVPFLKYDIHKEGHKIQKTRASNDSEKSTKVLIVGFGMTGQHLAKVLKETGISYRILELNGETVKKYKALSEPIFYGDATRQDILNKMRIEEAQVLVLVISEFSVLRSVVSIAKKMNPQLKIIVRVRHFIEIEKFKKLGAHHVIAEEFESSIEVCSSVLHSLHIPGNIIRNFSKILRDEGYAMLRSESHVYPETQNFATLLSGNVTESFKLDHTHFAVTKTLRELNLRQVTGAMVIGLIRPGRTEHVVDPKETLQAEDILIIVGAHVQLEKTFAYLESGDID